MSNEESAPRAGEVLAGRYYVERVLGEGGMGCVVAATHVHLDERVAVKLLHRHLLSDSDTVQRFLREGRTAGRIQSEHVVRIKDVGQLDDGRPYIVMEYLEGDDLAAILKKRGILPPQQAVDYVLAAAEAIAEAHAMKMLHRDIKPSNIFLARLSDGRECIKVLDFGIAKAFGAESIAGQLTATSMVMGTPVFMAPEQLRKSKALDHRVDIWALGVLLHKLVTNTLPFDGDTFAELSAAILTAEPPPLRRSFPHLPRELEAIVATCLRKNPEERFVDLADLALALAPLGTPASRPNVDRIVRTLGSPSQRAVVATTADPTPPPSTMKTGGSLTSAVNVTPVEPRRRTSGAVVAFGAAAATLAIAGVVAGGLALRARAARHSVTPSPVATASADPTPPVEPRVPAPPATNTDPPPVVAAAASATSAAVATPKTVGRPGAAKPAGGGKPVSPIATASAAPAVTAQAPASPPGIATSSKD